MKTILTIISLAFAATSCQKGYDINFANYSTEAIDSVVIGDNKIIFTGIDVQVTTAYQHIARGTYDATIRSHSKKSFHTQFFIPGNGTGKRTLEIDGTGAVYVVEH